MFPLLSHSSTLQFDIASTSTPLSHITCLRTISIMTAAIMAPASRSYPHAPMIAQVRPSADTDGYPRFPTVPQVSLYTPTGVSEHADHCVDLGLKKALKPLKSAEFTASKLGTVMKRVARNGSSMKLRGRKATEVKTAPGPSTTEISITKVNVLTNHGPSRTYAQRKQEDKPSATEAQDTTVKVLTNHGPSTTREARQRSISYPSYPGYRAAQQESNRRNEKHLSKDGCNCDHTTISTKTLTMLVTHSGKLDSTLFSSAAQYDLSSNEALGHHSVTTMRSLASETKNDIPSQSQSIQDTKTYNVTTVGTDLIIKAIDIVPSTPRALNPLSSSPLSHSYPNPPSKTQTPLSHPISPPGFFYPTSHPNLTTFPGGLSGLNFDLPDVPLSVSFLIFGFMFVGMIWAAVIYFVNFPPSFHASHSTKTMGEDEKVGNVCYGCLIPAWMPRRLGNGKKGKAKNKPIDKPSKYAPLADSDTGSAISAATWMRPSPANGGSGIEMMLRKPHNPRPPSNFIEPVIPTRPAPTPVPGMGDYRDGNSRIPTPPSSFNPLIPPTPTGLRTRTSEEWLAEREAFLSNPIPIHTPHDSSSDLSEFDPEAQTPVLAHRSAVFPPNPLAYYLHGKRNGKGNGLMMRSLSSIDGAVNRVVNGITRWTDDDDGEDEALLLPLRKGEKVE
ncbi:hypothetical protein K469DRAFT_746307 [Zopfia rhizophila CBS 207.26]|uniref:Uncharacterized protein n=1 Tax=Zopfia rhizophila CBS 207.26 TaxID=1314779 RepID=A0A6A6ELW3_9PEZI|nr:hypothetical protein K469DRAFT_746307 [Zopfia rhizophila CBS 207.26]